MWKVGGLQMKKVGTVDGRVNKQACAMTIGSMREYKRAKDNEGEEQSKPERGRQIPCPHMLVVGNSEPSLPIHCHQ